MNTSISDEGCKYLSKISLPNLKEICLGTQRRFSEYLLVYAKGCKYISQGNWPNLQILNLCK